MKRIRLFSTSDNHFSEAWNLYEEAFPVEERRSLEDQIRVFIKDDYHFEILTDEDQFIGFILWWDLEPFRYIDHFATSTQHRNKGFGRMILQTFISSHKKPILLEVELPTSDMNKRRIVFYERLGFQLNQHHYEIPPLEEEDSALQLLLMSYPNTISEKEVVRFVKNCHPIIFES